MTKIFYFDYAATTPVDPRVLRFMKPYFNEKFGNPSNLYRMGRVAKQAILEATKKITSALNCELGEFVFTGSATEADNLAIIGIARANKDKGNKIIISNVEHKGVLSVGEMLSKEGFEVVELPVDGFGLVNIEDLKKVLDEKTLLVSITYSDNETGSIQPIEKIGRIIREFREKNGSNFPYFHTDASQAAPYLTIDVKKLGVDLMTISAHKLYGPKGVGGLFIRKNIKVAPIIFGGGQQGKLRSGTENVPGIVGFGEAVRLNEEEKNYEFKRIKRLRDKLSKGIFKSIKKVILNGHPKNRLPNFLNVSILDIEGEAMLLYLDELNICVNTGSACNSQTLEPSYILTALGQPYEYVHGSLRFTLGRYTKESDINYVLEKLPPIVKILRKVSPLNLKLGDKKIMSQPQAFIGNQTPHFLRKKLTKKTK